MDIERLAEFAKEKARDIVESGEEHRVIALVATPGGGVTVAPSVDKEHFQAAFAAVLRRLRARGYVLVLESWFTTSRRPVTEGIAVSDLPLDDRTEAVVIVQVVKGRRQVLHIAPIASTPQGRRLGGWQRMEQGELAGRMVVPDW